MVGCFSSRWGGGGCRSMWCRLANQRNGVWFEIAKKIVESGPKDLEI